MFLLDTDHLTVLQRCSPQPEYDQLNRRMADFGVDDFALSIITIHEQMLGANAYISKANDRDGILRGYSMMQRTLKDAMYFLVLPFDEFAQREFEHQRHTGVRIATMDLRIACIALTRQLTVLTRNLVDFRAVSSLSVEDWTTPQKPS